MCVLVYRVGVDIAALQLVPANTGGHQQSTRDVQLASGAFMHVRRILDMSFQGKIYISGLHQTPTFRRQCEIKRKLLLALKY